MMEEGVADSLDMAILDSEISRLQELNSFESGLQLALQRQIEVERAKFEYMHNPFYSHSP